MARLVRSSMSQVHRLPDWTDFDVASFGNLLVELNAFVGNVLTFYQDNFARESRLVTASSAGA